MESVMGDPQEWDVMGFQESPGFRPFMGDLYEKTSQVSSITERDPNSPGFKFDPRIVGFCQESAEIILFRSPMTVAAMSIVAGPDSDRDCPTPRNSRKGSIS